MSEEPKMMTVDVFGQTLTLPEEQAKLLIAGRDDSKARMTELQSSIESKAATEAKALEDAETAEARRIAEEAASAGQLDQLKTFHAAELSKGQSQLKRLIISSSVASNEKVARSAVSDVADALLSNANIKLVNDSLIVEKADGTNITFDDHLNGYLEERPHFTSQTVPPSSGGTAPKVALDTPTITGAEYNAVQEKGGIEAREMAGKVMDNKITITQ